MAQIGAGLVGVEQLGFPNVIDTYQTYVNATPTAPDSASRIDAELVMDILKTLIAIELTLGANVAGVFGSLAARLNAFLPGSGGLPGFVSFTNAPSVAIPGTTHNVGQAALLWHLYDASIPANAIAPGAVTVQVDPSTYDVFLAFATPISGSIALGATTPLYVHTFTNTTSTTVLGTTHLLGTADILFKVYNNETPLRRAMEPGSLTVHPTTRDVVMTFTTPQSGILVLSSGNPAYATNFTNVTQVSIPGNIHQLGTKALLFQVYNNATPRAALGDPGVTVHPTTNDVVFSFATPTSGRVVLGAASTLSGQEFDLRDSGIINSSAVRIHSLVGNLYLNPGTGQHIFFQSNTGGDRITFDTQNTRVGIGTTTPSDTLVLAAGNAVKPGGGSWLAPSDERQKDDIRPFTDGLDVILALDPVLYRYSGRGGVPRSTTDERGLIAQAVQAVAPYMVQTRQGQLDPGGPSEDLFTLDTTALPLLLINAIKALHTWLLDVTQMQQQMRVDMLGLEQRLQRLEEAAT